MHRSNAHLWPLHSLIIYTPKPLQRPLNFTCTLYNWSVQYSICCNLDSRGKKKENAELYSYLALSVWPATWSVGSMLPRSFIKWLRLTSSHRNNSSSMALILTHVWVSYEWTWDPKGISRKALWLQTSTVRASLELVRAYVGLEEQPSKGRGFKGAHRGVWCDVAHHPGLKTRSWWSMQTHRLLPFHRKCWKGR